MVKKMSLWRQEMPMLQMLLLMIQDTMEEILSEMTILCPLPLILRQNSFHKPQALADAIDVNDS